MSSERYDPKAVVAGPAATMTVAGLAVGLLSGVAEPLYAGIAGGVGLVLAIVARVLPDKPVYRLLARLGIGMVVGALVYYMVAMVILPAAMSIQG